MSNLQSIAGGMVWTFVAGVLMLATFEPVSVEKKPGEAAVRLASAPATSPNSL